MCAESIILEAFRKWIKFEYNRDTDLNNKEDLNLYEVYRIAFKDGWSIRGTEIEAVENAHRVVHEKEKLLGPYIIYYEPGETYWVYSDGPGISTGNTLSNVTIAKRIIDYLLEDKDFSLPQGFRIAQKINGEFKEIFPTKENP